MSTGDSCYLHYYCDTVLLLPHHTWMNVTVSCQQNCINVTAFNISSPHSDDLVCNCQSKWLCKKWDNTTVCVCIFGLLHQLYSLVSAEYATFDPLPWKTRGVLQSAGTAVFPQFPLMHSSLSQTDANYSVHSHPKYNTQMQVQMYVYDVSYCDVAARKYSDCQSALWWSFTLLSLLFLPPK